MKKRATLLVVVLLLGALVWLVQRGLQGDRQSPEQVAVAEPQAVFPSAPATQDALEAAGEAPVRLLPPLDAPLAEILPELEQRAAAGESAAACRIAADRSACAWLRAQREHHLAWAMEKQRFHEGARKNSDPALSALALQAFSQELGRREAQLEAMEARCAGVAPASPAELAAAWRRAASLGSLSARRYWASGQAIQSNGVLNTLQELAIYREAAPAMAFDLVREGDLAMTLLMANATAPLSSRTRALLGQAVDEDAALSLALYRRALAAAEAAGSGHGEQIAQGIRQRIEVIEGLMSVEQLVEAQRREVEFDAWQPVDTGVVSNTLTARGEGIIVVPAHCQAEAGEPLPKDFHIRRRRPTPL